MKSEKKPKAGTVAKLPQVQIGDNGAYVCMVYPRGNSSSPLFAFSVDVAVDGEADLRERKAKALRNRIHLFFAFVDGLSGHQCQKLQQQHYLFKHPVATVLQSIYVCRTVSRFKSLLLICTKIQPVLL